LTAVYAGLVNAAVGAALLLRYDARVPADVLAAWGRAAPWFTALSLAGFLAAGLYHGLWRYAGTATLFQIVRGASLSAASWPLWTALGPARPAPPSLAWLVWLCELVLMGALRLAWRLWRDRQLGGSEAREVRTLVVGADHSAVSLVQEMRRQRSGEEWLKPLGFVDPDPRLTGHLVEGLKVLGTLADLPRVLRERRPEVAVVANPALPGRWVREVAEACRAAGVRLKTR